MFPDSAHSVEIRAGFLTRGSVVGKEVVFTSNILSCERAPHIEMMREEGHSQLRDLSTWT